MWCSCCQRQVWQPERTGAVLSRKWWSRFPPHFPPAGPPAQGRWGGGKKDSSGFSCYWLPDYFPAFRSSHSHWLVLLHIPTSADSRAGLPLYPHAARPLAQFPQSCPILLPVETLLPLQQPFSNTPVSKLWCPQGVPSS